MISYQLYSSRNFPPTADTLKMLAAAGYEGAEGFGGLYADKAGLADLAAGLKSTGLKMISVTSGWIRWKQRRIGRSRLPRHWGWRR